MENIGVFRDSFNPIHIGHINFLKIVKKEYNLDRIILVLTNNLKNNITLASIKDRINMCELATKGINFLKIYKYNLRQNCLVYTVDILKEIKKKYNNCELNLILPQTILPYFDRLYKLDEISKIAKIRSIASKIYYEFFHKKYNNINKDIDIIIKKEKLININPTKLRCMLAQREDCSEFLDFNVYEYIKNRNLYKGKNFLFWECYTVCKKHTSRKRFIHCNFVAKAAKELARVYGESEVDAKIAGILHDIMKEKTEKYMLNLLKKYNITLSPMQMLNPKVWHGLAGATYIKNIMGIKYEHILNAIKYHTIPRKDMTTFEKIIFIADSISQDRKYKDVKYQRKIAKENLDDAVLYRLKSAMLSLIKKQSTVVTQSLEFYNKIILQKNEEYKKNENWRYFKNNNRYFK